MKKAILWSVACLLVIIALLVNGWAAEKMGVITIVLAVLCAGLQWLVWIKTGKKK